MNTNKLRFKEGHSPFRVHMEDSDVIELLVEQLQTRMDEFMRRDLVVVCIGTDRSTGDSLGPFIGSMLEQQSLRHFHVYGTLKEPVHAINLQDQLNMIKRNHPRSFIIAIDACLGRSASVGTIILADGPVQPGAAVNKSLPAVGDIHFAGIVNVGGMMEYVVLQNTRLYSVIQMAETIATVITKADASLSVKLNSSTFFRSLQTTPFQERRKKIDMPL